MIKLETAMALKEAGLESNYKGPVVWNGKEERFYYAPRLDQLLVEIEAREYGYKLRTDATAHLYRVSLYKWGDTKRVFLSKHCGTPDEAAAQALLWILRQEKGDRE